MIDFPPWTRAADRRAFWPQAALLVLGAAVGLAIARLPLPLAAGLLALVAAVLLTLRFPLFGLALALLLGPFGALENVVLGGTALDSGQLALLFTLAAWLAAGLGRRRVRLPSTPFSIPWLLFVAIAGLSLLDAFSITEGIQELLKWIEIGLIVWLMLDLATPGNTPDSDRHPAVARAALAMLLVAGLVQAVIGIWQFGLRGDGPEHFLVLGRFYRAYGTFEQPNPFGGYMNLVALLAAGVLIGLVAARLERRRAGGATSLLSPAWLWWGLAGAAAAAGGLAVIFSWSRGAWLGFLAGVGVLVLFSSRRFLLSLGLALIAAAVLGGALYLGVSLGLGPAVSVAERLGGFADQFTLGDVRGVDINDENYAVLERLAHWQAAVGMAEDNPWTGVGFGNYEAAYPAYALINWPDALGHAHNYYLNLLAEVGVPGLLAYLIFWAYVVGRTVSLLGRLAWPQRGVAVGLLAAWAALAVHHLVDKLYVNNIYVHLGVMLGLLELLAWPRFAREPEIPALGEPAREGAAE